LQNQDKVQQEEARGKMQEEAGTPLQEGDIQQQEVKMISDSLYALLKSIIVPSFCIRLCSGEGTFLGPSE
jgi:hypothetical protein